MPSYNEPLKLVEPTENHHTTKYRVALITLTVIFAVGIFAALGLSKEAPTFNGKVDVAALQADPEAYDLSAADGAAFVIVALNRAKTTAENVCFSVVFNFRGYDTMGESFILIAALSGSLCILRNPGRKKKTKSANKANAAASAAPAVPAKAGTKPPRKAMGIIVRYGANLFLPLACTFGGYVVLHGDSSPGGGFQGGVLIAAAVLLVFLGYGSQKLSTTFKESFLHDTETVAEIMYIAIGMIGILVGLNFAVNFVFEIFHIETAVLMNNAVGYHVMAGVGCLLIMMLGMLGTSDSAPTEAELQLELQAEAAEEKAEAAAKKEGAKS